MQVRTAGPVFLPKPGAHTLGVQGWGTYMFAIFVTVWLVLSLGIYC